MSRIEQLSGEQDNTKLERMAAEGYTCVQVFMGLDGISYFGLFTKNQAPKEQICERPRISEQDVRDLLNIIAQVAPPPALQQEPPQTMPPPAPEQEPSAEETPAPQEESQEPWYRRIF